MRLTTAFSSRLFSTQPKSLNENVNISRTKRAFSVKIKSIFHQFYKGLPVMRNCLRHDSGPLRSKIDHTVLYKWVSDFILRVEIKPFSQEKDKVLPKRNVNTS